MKDLQCPYTGTAVVFRVVFYWVVPFLMTLCRYVRSVAEHFAQMDHSNGLTSTVVPYFWEHRFFAPHNIDYHLEHHLYPGVPFHTPPALHARLMRDGALKTKAHVTRGYSA